MNENRIDISTSVSSAAEILRDAGIPEARREASSLLTFVLGREPVFLIAHPEYILTETEFTAFESVISRRSKREPFQYIVGRKDFYGLNFEVLPGVLIPRPETEILVEGAIAVLSSLDDPSFLEIGIGSGCISVSILSHVEGARAVGVDISHAALALAATNARLHGVAARLSLRYADVYDSETGLFDMIVSNPPYIPDGDMTTLQPEVGRFEPYNALFGGQDGLDIVRNIVADAPKYLNPGGTLFIEIGFGQSNAVKELFDPEIWNDIEFLADLQGIQRIARAVLHNAAPKTSFL